MTEPPRDDRPSVTRRPDPRHQRCRRCSRRAPSAAPAWADRRPTAAATPDVSVAAPVPHDDADGERVAPRGRTAHRPAHPPPRPRERTLAFVAEMCRRPVAPVSSGGLAGPWAVLTLLPILVIAAPVWPAVAR